LTRAEVLDSFFWKNSEQVILLLRLPDLYLVVRLEQYSIPDFNPEFSIQFTINFHPKTLKSERIDHDLTFYCSHNPL
jgi:hypothetical protein